MLHATETGICSSCLGFWLMSTFSFTLQTYMAIPKNLFLFSVWQIFMAVVWLILEVIMLFFYFDLPKVMSKNDDDLCVSTDNSVNSDSVVKGEKQKLRNINGSYRKLQRTNSVMDDWHLAKGWFTVCQWQAFGWYIYGKWWNLRDSYTLAWKSETL